MHGLRFATMARPTILISSFTRGMQATRSLKTLRVRSCAVRRPLLAVADLNDRGWDVHFMAKHGAWAEHPSGDVVSFQRVGGRFEFEAAVMGDGSSGNGPGRARL